MSKPVPRHLRNPRRAYDENGIEIAPPTIGWLRAEGEITASIYCLSCPHHAVISTDPFPADLPFPDIALRVRCSACSSKQVQVAKDMVAHYARLKERFGWGAGS